MSKITLTPNASGTAAFNVASPATNTDRTLTLPDQTGTLLSNAGPVTVSALAPVGSISVDSAGNTNLLSLNGGQLAGNRNKIINGKMEIAQRGTSFAAIAMATPTYTADRFFWYYQNSTAVVTVSQQADAPSNNEFQNSLRVAVTTADTSIASNEQHFVAQLIEGFNARDLIGRTFTLSFWARSSKTGVHCVSFLNSGQDRSFIAEYTINAANTWEYKTITVSGGLITAGTWNWTSGVGIRVLWSLAAGSAVQSTVNAWQTGAFFATSNQVNCMDTIGNIFAITGVQLEAGSVATPFEHRPYGVELAMCQRYYFRITGSGTIVGNVVLGGSLSSYTTITPPVTMRAAGQTIDMGGSLTIQDNITSVTASSLTNQNTHPNSFTFSYSHGSLTQNTLRRAYLADANSYFGLSSEL